MASRRAFLISALAVFILSSCASASSSSAPSTPPPTPPPRTTANVLPSTSIRGLDNTETQLPSAISGRPALVTLWATWCDACRHELPALTKIDAWARDRGAVVVGVAVGEPIAKVSGFTSANHVPYLVLVDEDFHLADALGEKRVPTTLVIDRGGHIVYVGGAVDEHSLAAFRKVLGAAASASSSP